jgi:hypothetical protein
LVISGLAVDVDALETVVVVVVVGRWDFKIS